MTGLLPTDEERMLRDSVRGTYARGSDVAWSELAELGWQAQRVEAGDSGEVRLLLRRLP